mmetsp:Transcript_21869/g.67343  ORF Transcript_21869/g.67343 Transcript_21869/m.67343 type:complete len:428 (+) Transcript_21869:896-2179(+)
MRRSLEAIAATCAERCATVSRSRALRTAGATAAVVVVTWPLTRRVCRFFVELADPVAPSALEAQALLERPLRCEDVEAAIAEPRATTEGAARRVTWATPALKRKTEVAVVYLHGWGACRQEIAPTPQMVARALGANLYCHRLSGHGRRRRDAPDNAPPDGDVLLREATPGRLFRDALEALRIGRALGDRVVLLGVSTGGALATWLCARDKTARDAITDEETIAALVLVSPCYGLGHPLYPLLKMPFAALRALPAFVGRPLRDAAIVAVMGPTKRSARWNDDHGRFNCLAYPQPALLHLLDVLFSLERLDVGRVSVPTFLAANQGDPVIDFTKAADHLRRLGTARPEGPPAKVLFACPSREHHHVLASQMLSPSTVDAIADAAILFVRSQTGRGHGLQRRNAAMSSRPSFGSFGSLVGLDTLARPFPF